MTRVLLLATNPSLTKCVEEVPDQHVGFISGDTLAEIDRLDGLIGLFVNHGNDVPDVVVLGDLVPVEDCLSIAEFIDANYPEVDMFLVAEPEADVVMRAMRVGIREIVPSSIGPDELKVLFHRASSNVSMRLNARPVSIVPEQVDPSRVIVVVSPKGGVGKSTVAANVAVTLAKTSPMETVLVDLDLQFGDAGIMLNLEPLHSVADAFESTAALDTLILKTFLTVHPSGCYVLCAAASPTASAKISAEQISHLLKQLSSQFRYVVVDTSTGLDECTLSAVQAASDLIMVSSMDRASTGALRKEIDVLANLGLIPPSQHVVLNFANRRAGLGVRDVETAIGLPVDVVIPLSLDVPFLGNLGVAFMERKRGGPVVKAFHQLVARIHADEESDLINKHRGMEVV